MRPLHPRPTWSLFAGLLALTLALSACSRPPQLHQISGFAEGTTYQITFWSAHPIDFDRLNQQINQTLAGIDKEMSTYQSDSYISRFNRSRSTAWQPASADFIRLLQIARKVYHKSHGCYDPTIQPLFALWGFQRNVFHAPTAQQIAAVKKDLGLDKLQVDVAGRRIRKTLPGLQLDFSSMGEGYTIRKLSHLLEAAGVTNYLVEFGGDLRAQGHKPGGTKWRIAIERPVAGQQPVPYRVLTIEDEHGVTLDTSGTYHHSFDEHGKQYSHILDPRSGAPITHDLVSASVFGTDAPVSDAWATAMLCLGPTAGAQVARANHLEVFFIRDEHGHLVSSESPALATTGRVKFAPRQ